MSSVITRKGLIESLKLVVSVPVILRLYENNVYPNYHHEINDYKEASGGGYVVKILEPENWKFSLIADSPVATYPDQLFEFTGPVGLVHGYYVTDEKNKIVRWAERFADGPYEVLRLGDAVTVITRIRLPRK
ncbi:MAG: hypothetical protein ACXAEN_24335 [Candidatus Thorarchaeota archaeon]|jgi:hypothetical protein